MRRLHLPVLSLSMFLVACTPAAPETPKTEFKAVANTQDVMESLVAHMSQNIWEAARFEIDQTGIHEIKPKNKEEWQEVGYSARGLAEASSLLMYEGRVEDHGDWEKFVKELTKTSLEAAKAADDQSVDALMTAGGRIYEACKGCHDQYIKRVQEKRTGGKPAEAPATAPPGQESKEPAPGGEKK